MKITVIVPTYRRPKDLSRCLEALKKQTRPADELLVVVRDTDAETWIFMETFTSETLPLRTVTVSAPGAIAAMNAGLDAASGEIVSFTDDDAAPHTDWLARIEPHFLSDSRVGGVGGRDWVYHGTDLVEGAKEVVGQVQWFGRAIGNHHLGVGEAREVDVLKGVNMSFRWTAIKNKHFDQRMQGTSAQIHHEIKVAVDHHTGQRFDEDQRNKFNPIAMKNIVCNETLALLEHLPSTRRVVFLTWAILVGTRGEPGLVQWLRFMPSQGSLATQKLQASLQGRRQGWQTWQQSRLGKDV
ncbi:MAG: glycosyl transferase family A [Cyanobacteria bacterium SW_5_48_44]|nr:MAG: glycosyl transferase family A [Cyanobacteria bacterium SW_5_48_44]